MTEQIKSAIEEIENMRKFNYTLSPNEVFNLAIRSLQAWEEVLQELEEKRIEFANLGMYLCNNALDYAIDIINHHLAKIKE